MSSRRPRAHRAGWVPVLLASQAFADVFCGPGWLEGLPAIDGPVHAVTTWDPDGDGPLAPLLVIGGGFAHVGDVEARNVAAFDGQTWSPLGGGTNAVVFDFAVYEGDLIAGGSFTEADGETVNYIARWNGVVWSPIGEGFSSFVNSLAVYNGELIAGGWFVINGQRSIARWTGTAWEPLGGGVSQCTNCGADVNAMTVYNGELIVGGFFQHAGSVPAKNIARWNGTNWASLGGGANNQVFALTVYNGDLIVGGQFTHVSLSNLAVNHIARWNGFWGTLGSGIDNSVWGLAVNNDVLYATGFFTTAGDNPASNIAAWDGANWSDLGGGLNSTGFGLAVFEGDLIAVGHFEYAGGNPSGRWGRWRDTPPPVFAEQPTFKSVPIGESVTFTALATGTGELHYQWRHNFAPLMDDDRISGATSPELSISPAIKTDAGSYDVIVTDDCHSVSSTIVGLTVTCPALVGPDFNNDCDVDADDFDVFLTCAGGPARPPLVSCPYKSNPQRPIPIRPDFNHDGDVDLDDFAVLQRCYGGADVLPSADCDD